MVVFNFVFLNLKICNFVAEIAKYATKSHIVPLENEFEKKFAKNIFKKLINSVFIKFFKWLILISFFLKNCNLVAKIAKFAAKSHIAPLENDFEKKHNWKLVYNSFSILFSQIFISMVTFNFIYLEKLQFCCKNRKICNKI